jgi:hypothetical protein
LGSVLPEPEGVVGEERLEKALLLVPRAELGDLVAPFPVLAERLRHRAVAARQLRHHDALRDEVRAGAAPFLRHGNGAEAEAGALAHDLPVPGAEPALDLVAGEGRRAQFVPRELARLQLPAALLFVEREVHVAGRLET